MILALDISMNTGWAFGDGTPQYTSFGTYEVQNRKDYVYMGYEYAHWIREILEEHDPDKIIIEAPVFIGRQVNYALTILHHKVHEEAHAYKRIELSPSAIKKHMTGNGRAPKPQMVEAVRKRGFDVLDDNQADAVALILTHKEKR